MSHDTVVAPTGFYRLAGRAVEYQLFYIVRDCAGACAVAGIYGHCFYVLLVIPVFYFN